MGFYPMAVVQQDTKQHKSYKITHHAQTKHITQNYKNNNGHTTHNEYNANTITTTTLSWRSINNSLTVTSNHTWSLLFTALFLSCYYSAAANSEDSTQFNSSAPKFISWKAGVPKLTLIRLLKWTFHYNHFAWTTKKTQPLYCWEGVFTAPIASCVFVVAVMCFHSCCLAMNFYSDFTILAFGRHVTICYRKSPKFGKTWIYASKLGFTKQWCYVWKTVNYKTENRKNNRLQEWVTKYIPFCIFCLYIFILRTF
jgi:hypothetical protein